MTARTIVWSASAAPRKGLDSRSSTTCPGVERDPDRAGRTLIDPITPPLGYRRRVSTRATLTTLVLGALASISPDVRAAEVAGELAPLAGASTWRGDTVVGGQLRLALRFAHVVAVDVVTWETYGAVDRRANTGLTFGVTGFLPLEKVRPFARLFAIHQHEEGLVAVREHPWGTLFGIGAGIRHRAGGGATLGAEVPFHRLGSAEVYGVFGVTSVWFPDATLGPAAYVMGYVGVGGTLELTVAP